MSVETKKNAFGWKNVDCLQDGHADLHGKYDLVGILSAVTVSHRLCFKMCILIWEMF